MYVLDYGSIGWIELHCLFHFQAFSHVCVCTEIHGINK